MIQHLLSRVGPPRYYVIREALSTIHSGFFFKKGSYLKIPFDRVIIALREAGILDKIISNYVTNIPTPLKAMTSQNEERKVLTLSHYETQLYLVLAMLCISSFSFILEILYKKYHTVK